MAHPSLADAFYNALPPDILRRFITLDVVSSDMREVRSLMGHSAAFDLVLNDLLNNCATLIATEHPTVLPDLCIFQHTNFDSARRLVHKVCYSGLPRTADSTENLPIPLEVIGAAQAVFPEAHTILGECFRWVEDHERLATLKALSTTNMPAGQASASGLATNSISNTATSNSAAPATATAIQSSAQATSAA